MTILGDQAQGETEINDPENDVLQPEEHSLVGMVKEHMH